MIVTKGLGSRNIITLGYGSIFFVPSAQDLRDFLALRGLDLCPIEWLRLLYPDVSDFSQFELDQAMNDVIGIFLQDPGLATFMTYYELETIFKETDIALSLARTFCVHRVAVKLYFSKNPMADWTFNIQSWVDISREALKKLVKYINHRVENKFISTPVWYSPENAITEKGVSAVGTFVDMNNLQKNTTFTR